MAKIKSVMALKRTNLSKGIGLGKRARRTGIGLAYYSIMISQVINFLLFDRNGNVER